MLLGLMVWTETASAFYNPSTGRWLNRDPIGELGHQRLPTGRGSRFRSGDGNLYCFVGNNPLTKFDLLGLSESDVTDITEQFRRTMKRMCDNGQRCDCFGIGPLKDIRSTIGLGKPWGCGYQATALDTDLLKLDLDDGWDIRQRSYFTGVLFFRHQDVEARSTDGKSGDVVSIVLDTFKGCYTVNKREAFYLPGFPTVYFFFNTHYSVCLTCDDFKNW